MKTFKEKLHTGLNQEIKIKKRLINKKSNFQKIEKLTFFKLLSSGALADPSGAFCPHSELGAQRA